MIVSSKILEKGQETFRKSTPGHSRDTSVEHCIEERRCTSRALVVEQQHSRRSPRRDSPGPTTSSSLDQQQSASRPSLTLLPARSFCSRQLDTLLAPNTQNCRRAIGWPPAMGSTHHQASPHQSSFPPTPNSLQSVPGRSAPGSAGYGGQQPSQQQQQPPIPSIQTTFSQIDSASRPTTMSSTHSYSRSSPAVGLDPKYTPFSNTPDTSRYTSSSGSKFIPQTPTGAASNSPLALADIRPVQPELHMGDDLSSPAAFVNKDPPLTQTASSYVAPWPIYAYDWCNWPINGGSSAGKMAICSHLEDAHNYIQVLDTHIEGPDMNNPSMGFSRVAEATCSYPVTRILWEPPSPQKQTTDLLATSGDHLRLWSLPQGGQSQRSSNTIHQGGPVSRRQSPVQKLTPLALLSNSKTPEHTAPLTSLDWNKVSPKLIITSSIDTTCTIWDIPTLTAKTQLIAHDKEVFDVRFCAGSVDTFVSCGADGSVRMFDLRSLEHSTIIYEPSEKNDKGLPSSPRSRSSRLTVPAEPSPGPMSPGGNQPSISTSPPPLLRIAASPHDSHLLATFAADSRVIRILDHRQPGQALLELHGHSAAINCIEWSPTRRGMLASGADDSQVLYWDLMNSHNGATLAPPGTNGNNVFGGPIDNSSSSAGSSAGGAGVYPSNAKGPAARWRADYEVSNLSWSPRVQAHGGGEWLGVTGGRAVWGVRI